MGNVEAKPIPDVEEIKLDPYTQNISDYRFPSGLRIMFQSEQTQPVVAVITIDRGSEYAI